MICVVIPTYNERENIAQLLSDILGLSLGATVVVVDDNSPDGTGRILDEYRQTSNRIEVIHRPGKLGLGTAHVAGFKRSLALGADLIISMDADFSHHPRYLPGLCMQASQFDLVIGSRYVPGGGSRNCGWNRTFLSRGANSLARTALGLQATDCTAGFRCYRREVLEGIPLDNIVSNGYSFLIELLYAVQKRGYRIGEIPIIFENRQLGSSKISSKEVFQAMKTVGRLGMIRLGTSKSEMSSQ